MDKQDLLLDAIFFEHWARYFCFEETEDGVNATIEIPEALYAECKTQLPHLLGLLEKIQHSPIVLNDVKSAIFSFIRKELSLTDNELEHFLHEMSLNADFNRKLNMFYGFVQDEADKDSKTEDSMSDKEYKTYRAKKEIPLFPAWMEQFHNWAKENNHTLS
ncbi:hypothetical protein JBF11_09135 [Taurinivorans muris]|uniref:Uncharacterized protein n=1 Tax=Taurinivorans muris TaxID=2787751 RepID=A0ABY5Y0B3_9BACT|nr:hypothetical protein JBF11_09135 [Desulfovibrionaceae bacterium LT0009]